MSQKMLPCFNRFQQHDSMSQSNIIDESFVHDDSVLEWWVIFSWLITWPTECHKIMLPSFNRFQQNRSIFLVHPVPKNFEINLIILLLHRSVLGIFSQMLADIFTYTPCCQKASIMFPDTSSEVLSHLLNVLYTGKIILVI